METASTGERVEVHKLMATPEREKNYGRPDEICSNRHHKLQKKIPSIQTDDLVHQQKRA